MVHSFESMLERAGAMVKRICKCGGAGSRCAKDRRCLSGLTALTDVKTAVYKAALRLGYACEAGSGPCFVLWEINGSLYSQSTL
ncbi:protein E18A [Elephant endotheliotropic herpesvirus 5B]|nr:protein E18A [Elephant endotheliotropic herpesvirus 5B]